MLEVAAVGVCVLTFAQWVEVLYFEHRSRYLIQASAYGIPGGIARRWWWTRRARVWLAVFALSLVLALMVWLP